MSNIVQCSQFKRKIVSQTWVTRPWGYSLLTTYASDHDQGNGSSQESELEEAVESVRSYSPFTKAWIEKEQSKPVVYRRMSLPYTPEGAKINLPPPWYTATKPKYQELQEQLREQQRWAQIFPSPSAPPMPSDEESLHLSQLDIGLMCDSWSENEREDPWQAVDPWVAPPVVDPWVKIPILPPKQFWGPAKKVDPTNLKFPGIVQKVKRTPRPPSPPPPPIITVKPPTPTPFHTNPIGGKFKPLKEEPKRDCIASSVLTDEHEKLWWTEPKNFQPKHRYYLNSKKRKQQINSVPDPTVDLLPLFVKVPVTPKFTRPICKTACKKKELLKKMESDEDLVEYLKLQSAFVPRTVELCRQLKQQAQRFMARFDLCNYTPKEVRKIILNGVSQAMLYQPEEEKLRALLHSYDERVINKPLMNQFFLEGKTGSTPSSCLSSPPMKVSALRKFFQRRLMRNIRF